MSPHFRMAAPHSLIVWRLRRAWALGPAPWWAWCAAFAGALVVAGGGLIANQSIARQIELANGQLAIARTVVPLTATPTPVEARDFTHALAPATPVVQVVEELRRSCERSNVVLASVQVRERPASDEQLGRAELLLTLRGSYGDSKQVLKDATDRFSKLTVQRLRMRRLQAPADVETTATLSLWAAPLAAAQAKSILVATP